MTAARRHEPSLSRRLLLRRAATAGLLASPAATLLVACSDADTADATATPTDKDEEPGLAGVLVLHHAQGLTKGIRAFADQLREAGHTVHTPDLYNGKTFSTLDEGVDYATRVGFQTIQERGVRSADELPGELVYIGFSLGVLPAQELAQNRAGARGAVLLEGCAPSAAFGSWPADVPVQIHGMDEDAVFAGEGDIANARALVEEADDGELFVYPGDQHLFTDSSLPTYDEDAAALVVERVLDLLARL